MPHRRISRVWVKTDEPIARDSPDHLHPWGARRDNSRNPRFNEKLYWLFRNHETQLTVLDLGCSGGGFVRDLINDGCLAVGVEGSDYSKLYQRAEWATVEHFLFTADITQAFEVWVEDETNVSALEFDVVTAWEVMEHIRENDIARVCDNVRRHLKRGGIWIMSISTVNDIIRGVNLHQTVRPRAWWVETLQKCGFEELPDLVAYFNTQFVRGPKQGAKDSVHLIVTNDNAQAPKPVKLGFASQVLDWWLFSKPHRIVYRLVCGSNL